MHFALRNMMLLAAVCACMQTAIAQDLRHPPRNSSDDTSVTQMQMAAIGRIGEQDRQALVSGDTQFAIDLYQQLAKETPDGNLFFSPYSLSTAIAMLAEGAQGETVREIADTCHYKVTPTTLGPANAELHAALHQGLGPRNELLIANSIWMQRDYPIVPAYLATIRGYYQGQAETVDFGNAGPTAKLINQWAESATRGHIPSIVTPGSIDSQTRLMVLNAVYFNGKWASAFIRSGTRPEPFHRFDGKSEPVAMMFQLETFPYVERSDYQAVSLPYKQSAFSMTLILPKQTGKVAMRRLEQSLNATKIDTMHGGRKQREVELYLPRLSLETNYDLRKTLHALGIKRVFYAQYAQLGGISRQDDLYVSVFQQKATLDVDEEGTVATAVTRVDAYYGGAIEEPEIPVVFRADRPFLVMIRHEPTGSILFMGRIEDAAQFASQLSAARPTARQNDRPATRGNQPGTNWVQEYQNRLERH